MSEPPIKSIEALNNIEICGDLFLELVNAVQDRFSSLPLDAKPYDLDITGFISAWARENAPKDKEPAFVMALILRYLAFAKIAAELPSDQARPIDDVKEYLIKESAIRSAAITHLAFSPDAQGLGVAHFEKEDFLANARRLAIELAEEEDIATA